MKTVFIYALCEPGTRTVRYIGKATNPKERFREHVWHSVKRRTHLGNWLRKLRTKKELPNLVVIRSVPETEWVQAEIAFIRIARGLGMDLVNSTDGGEGITRTPETKAKLALAWTPERRIAQALRIAEAQRCNVGRSLSDEHRAKLRITSRAAHSGKPKSEAHRRAMQESQRGAKSWTYGKPHSPEHQRAHLAARWRRCLLEHSEKFYGNDL